MEKKNCRSASNALLFLLSRSAAVVSTLVQWYSILVPMFMHTCSRNDHNHRSLKYLCPHRLFIKYTGFFRQKIRDKSGSSILFLACLGRTKRLVLPPAFVQQGCNIGSCTRPSKTSASCMAIETLLRINLLRNLQNACSL